MSKGLDKLKIIRHIHNMECGEDASINKDFDIIEKELKEGEENKKMLNIFKNALTIEHHEIAELDHSQDANDYFVRTLFNIKQNQIDNALCKTLREWVLKNAFPKELKALEIIKDICKLKVYKNKLGQCFLEGTNILFPISQETYDLLKEELL